MDLKFDIMLGFFSKYFSIVIFVCAITALSGQNTSSTIKDEFNKMVDKSGNYQDFKVVKRTDLNSFFKLVSDSLNSNNSEINRLSLTINILEEKVDSLNSTVTNLKNEHDLVAKQKNSFSFLGILMSKGAYNFLVWGLIIILGGLFTFFYLRFSNSHAETRKAKELYNKTKSDFQNYKEKTLEKEQVVMRKLQDEINKNLNK